jgi:hypothetical protein
VTVTNFFPFTFPHQSFCTGPGQMPAPLVYVMMLLVGGGVYLDLSAKLKK